MGFDIEPQRKLTKLSSGGISASVSSDDAAKMGTVFVNLKAAYRWNIFYIPFGITYGSTSFTPAASSSTTDTIAVQSGVGAVIGLGWYVDDNLMIEYVGRSATTGFDIKTSTGSEHTTGILSSALLSLKYLF